MQYQDSTFIENGPYLIAINLSKSASQKLINANKIKKKYWYQNWLCNFFYPLCFMNVNIKWIIHIWFLVESWLICIHIISYFYIKKTSLTYLQSYFKILKLSFCFRVILYEFGHKINWFITGNKRILIVISSLNTPVCLYAISWYAIISGHIVCYCMIFLFFVHCFVHKLGRLVLFELFNTCKFWIF